LVCVCCLFGRGSDRTFVIAHDRVAFWKDAAPYDPLLGVLIDRIVIRLEDKTLARSE